MTKHEFGGRWTLIKLDLLERYLTFFNTALQKQPKPEYPFDRVYIDAFAGTGICDIKVSSGARLAVKGSAKIAIDTHPPFHQVHLVDLNSKHVAELQALDSSTQATKISIYQDDANTALQRIVDQVNWLKTRGVLFLDPYGMAVEWATLQRIADTHALDVWYLFPLSAVYRQAARNFDRIDEGKAAVLDKVLGTPDWRQVFYETSKQDSLLDKDSEPTIVRTASPAEIATYVHKRLMSVFKGWVSTPIFLPEHGAPMFVLFFAASNPSAPAVKLSKKAADHLFKMHSQKRIGEVPNHAVTPLNSTQIDLF